MKLVLVFPPFAFPTYVPLGLAQIKSYLEKNNKNLEVKCLDLNLEFHKRFLDKKFDIFKKSKLFNEEYNNESKEFISSLTLLHKKYDDEIEEFFTEGKLTSEYLIEFVNRIVNEKPDIVGFSTTLSTQWHSACFMSRIIKELNPNIKIVFGGSSFSTKAKEKFNNNFMDFLIYGEAELAFDSLINNINSPSKVPSLIYEKDNKIIATKKQELSTLNEMPVPDFSDYNLKEYYNPEIVLPVYTSRSCAWKKCTYCIHYKTFEQYKSKTVNNFFDEMKEYTKKGITYFNFVDEMIFPKFIYEFCDKIINENLEIFWHCTLKPMKGFDKELMRKMYKAGCRLIFWGVESGNQEILNKMNKGVTVEEMRDNLADSTNAGIKNYCLVIVGFPGEKQEELNDTCNFLRENHQNIHSVLASPFFLYEESEVFDKPEKYGITKIYDKDQVKRNYLYDIKDGFNYDQIVLVYNSHQEFFDSFNDFSNSFGVFRDQGLIYYSNN